MTFRKLAFGHLLLISSLFFAQNNLALNKTSFNGTLLDDESGPKTSSDYLVVAKIDSIIEQKKNDPVLRNADWGFVVYDPKSDEVLASYNATEPLVPASTNKLLTTDTAYSLLGPNYRWTTQLEYSGTLSEDGVVNGNLYLISSGDPSIGVTATGASSYWQIADQFRTAMRDAGIRKVTGNLVIETAVFKGQHIVIPPNIVWLEHNNYFVPAGSTKGINPVNESTLNRPSGVAHYYYVSPYTGKIVTSTTFSGSTTLTGKIPPAPAYLANVLRSSLVKGGISVGQVKTLGVDDDPDSRKYIASYQSPILSDIIYFTNQTSNNRLAEEFMHLSGFYQYGDLSITSGRMAVENNLKNIGFDLTGLNYVDGSGLSHSNSVTPIAQAKFLAGEMSRSYFDSYFNSLPIAGETGTLKRMFLNQDTTGKIHAKTGTLNRVKTLAGYIQTNTGRTLTFSLLVKNYAGNQEMVKRKMEDLLSATVNL